VIHNDVCEPIMHEGTNITKYTSGRRATLVLLGFLLFTLLVPIFALIEEDGVRRMSEQFARNRLVFSVGVAFWLVFSTIMAAAMRANYLIVITCGPQVCRYRLPHVTAWDFFRRPFALRTGEIAYSMIRGVETRREAIKWGRTCSAVCLIVRDQPLRTFVRGAVGDHQWVEAFARDIASRANATLVDRGTVSSMFTPWR
jgi:hypothetical protein